jgi:predicted outer membrane repeat protein
MINSLLRHTYFLLLVSALLISVQVATAQTIRYVTLTGTTAPASATTSWATSTTDLQGAINASASGDQVWIKAGLYVPTTTTGPASRTISFAMKNGVTIYGNFTGTETALTQRTLTYPLSTTLSGDIGTPGSTADNSYHVISNPQGLTTTAVLDGVLITAGNANGSFPDYNGGGVYNNGFRGVCSPTVRNCVFVGNSASSNGGAVYNENGQGSGFNGIVAPTFIECVFLNNSAGAGGGAVSSSGDNNQPSFTNCSFSGNTGGYLNGSVFYNPANTTVTLTNSVLFGNGTGQISNAGTGTAVANYSLFETGVSGYSGSNNLTTTVSPFVSASDLRLNLCALAINAGNPATTTATVGATDLAGNPRIFGGQIDMGAFELQSATGTFTGITLQPASGSLVCAGATVTAAVSVSGSSPYSYQWYRNGAAVTNVASATTATLTLTNVQSGSSGSYSVVVTGNCNSATSSVFSLTANPLATIVRQPAAMSAVCVGTTVVASVSAIGTSPLSYQWYTNGAAITNIASATTSSLTLVNAQASAAGAYSAVVVSGGCSSSVTSSALNLSFNPTIGIVSQPPANSVVCSGTSISIQVSVTSTQTITYQWYKNGAEVFAASQATLTLNNAQPSASGSYSLVATSNCVNVTSAVFSLTVNASTTFTTQPPARVAACIGEAVTIGAVAIGTGTLTYQWYKNGTAITGIASATTATLILSNAQPSDAGTYSVVVIGLCNSVTSTASTLVMNPTVPTVSQPVAGSVACNAATVTISVSAVSTGALFYQWYKNGIAITGVASATTNTLTVSPAVSEVSSYFVLVSSACVSTTSASYTLNLATRKFVKPVASGTGDGSSWINASGDLQAMINASCTFGEVWVMAGLYLPTTTTGPASRTISFAMKNNVAVYGNFAGTETTLAQRTLTYPLSTTLSGDIGTPGSTTDNSYHVVYNPQGIITSAVLDGVLITGGNANGSFPDYDGGGMYNYGFRGVCSPTVRNCVFVGNSASTSGGAVYNNNGQGSSYNGITAPTFTECILLNNSAGAGGGAVASVGDNNQPSFTNCSFGGNTGGYLNGGALYNPANTRTVLSNCILFGNGTGAISNGGNGTVVAAYNLFEASMGGYAGVNNLTANTSPFVSTTSNLQLTTCSLAINAGDPATATSAVGTADLGGNVRVVGRRIDMGAFEAQTGSGVFPVTVADGAWNTGAVWFCGRVPMVSDAVQVLHVVSLPNSYVGGAGQVTFGTSGTLRYGATARFVVGQ